MFIALGVLFAPVSFASDGPPTNKEATFISDVNHAIVISTESVDFDFIKYEALSVNDVGKTDLQDYNTNYFGLPSFFNWESLETSKFPNYNEWLIYKH